MGFAPSAVPWQCGEFVAAGDAFKALLAHFQVGARTAAHQLWNQGLLASRQDRDALIDEFGSLGA